MTKLIIIAFIVISLIALISVAFVLIRRKKAQESDNQAPLIKNAHVDGHPDPSQANFSQTSSMPTATSAAPAPRNSLMIAQSFLDQQRYDEAESELKLGLQMHPTDNAIPLKLLNLYAVTNNQQSFQDVYAYILDKGDTQAIQQAEQIKSLLDAEQASLQPVVQQPQQSAQQQPTGSEPVIEEDTGLDFQAFSESLEKERASSTDTPEMNTVDTQASFDSLEDSLLEGMESVDNSVKQSSTANPVAEDQGLAFDLSLEDNETESDSITKVDEGNQSLTLESDLSSASDDAIDFSSELSLEEPAVIPATSESMTGTQSSSDNFELSLDLDSADNQPTVDSTKSQDFTNDDFDLDLSPSSNQSDTELSLDTSALDLNIDSPTVDDGLSLEIDATPDVDDKKVVPQTQDASFDLSLESDTSTTTDKLTASLSIDEPSVQPVSDQTDGLDFSSFDLEIDSKDATNDQAVTEAIPPLEADLTAFEDVNLDIDPEVALDIEENTPNVDSSKDSSKDSLKDSLKTETELAEFDFEFDDSGVNTSNVSEAVDSAVQEQSVQEKSIETQTQSTDSVTSSPLPASVDDMTGFEDVDLDLEAFENRVLGGNQVDNSDSESSSEPTLDVGDTLAQLDALNFGDQPTLPTSSESTISESTMTSVDSPIAEETTSTEVASASDTSNASDIPASIDPQPVVQQDNDVGFMPTVNELADFDIVNDLDQNQVTLDLASQYLDLGEYDSAKRLLTEVIEQGSEEQQQTAQTLLLQAG